MSGQKYLHEVEIKQKYETNRSRGELSHSRTRKKYEHFFEQSPKEEKKSAYFFLSPKSSEID